jgi:Ser/Thr protein kinase RdoA (MazF antagonist)
MRLANLLVAPGRTVLIDFDDCGFCWFAYDLAASLSFIETDPRVPALRDAWIEGYLRNGALAAADIRAMDAMILLRRMALLAWIGSHAETSLARAHAGDFAADTARLAERYLGGGLWS